MLPRLFDPEDDQPRELTVADVIRAYLTFKDTQQRAGMIEEAAVYGARLYCFAFAEFVGAQAVISCRRTDVSRFLALHPEYRSPHTLAGAAGAVVACFRWAAEFPNGQGRPWNRWTFSKLFRRHAKLAGVRAEVSAYSLRHGWCVEALEAGVGERQIADAMGHVSTKFIGWYGRGVRSKIDYLRESMERRKK